MARANGMKQFVHRPTVIEAERFDPKATPWPSGVVAWPADSYKPRDASWGYVIVNGGRMHVHSGDWICRNDEGYTWVVEDRVFSHLYDRAQGEEQETAIEGNVFINCQISSTDFAKIIDRVIGKASVTP